jgi:hypothetical protein
VLYPNDATYEGKELRLRQQQLGAKRREGAGVFVLKVKQTKGRCYDG